MPNWCSNEERIFDPRKEIVPLFQNIRKWTSKNYRENGFGNLLMWMEMAKTVFVAEVRCPVSRSFMTGRKMAPISLLHRRQHGYP